MAGQLTMEQFGQKIKAKYPQYASVSDKDLAARVIAKYPQYRSQVVLSHTMQPGMTGQQGVQENTGIHPYNNPVAQGAAGVGRALWGAISAPYQMGKAALVAPTNPEEQAAKDQWGGLGLAFDRMLVQPAEAAHSEANEFRASGRPVMGAMAELGAVPIVGSMGQELGTRVAAGDYVGAATEGLTNVALPELTKVGGEAGLSAVGKLRQNAANGIRNSVRNLTESGVEFTQKHARDFEKDSEEIRAKNKAAGEETLKKRGIVDDANAAARKKAGQDRQEAAAVHQRDLEKHHADLQEVRAHNQAVANDTAEKAQLAEQIPKSGAEYEARLHAAETSARTENDEAWNTLREKVADIRVPLGPIQDRVEMAQSNDPMSAAIFKPILEQEGVRGEVKPVSDEHGLPLSDADPEYSKNYERMYGTPPPITDGTGSVTFDRLHRWNQWINHRIIGAKGQMEPGLYAGLTSVQEAVGEAMGDAAKQAGASADLTRARQLHRDMAETFRDSPNSRATSATASIRENAGADYVAARDRQKRLKMLSRYDPGIQGHADSLRGMQKRHDAIKPAKLKDEPAPPAPPDAIPAKEPQPYGEPEKHRPLQEAPDITAARKTHIAIKLKKYGAWGSWVARILLGTATGGGFEGATALGSDLFRGQVALNVMTKVLRRPNVIDWLSRPTEEDLAEIAKLPPKEAERLRKALGGMADLDKQRDAALRRVKIDPRMAAFLAGGAIGAQATQIPQTAGEAKRRVAALQ